MPCRIMAGAGAAGCTASVHESPSYPRTYVHVPAHAPPTNHTRVHRAQVLALQLPAGSPRPATLRLSLHLADEIEIYAAEVTPRLHDAH